jgi:hypothetical protein
MSTLNTRQDQQLQVNIEDFTYSTYFGGDDVLTGNPGEDIEDKILDVTTDSHGNIIVTGNTLSSNFPVLNAFQDTFAGGGNDVHGVGGDAFLTKFDPNGQLLWSTFLGGNDIDGGKFVKAVGSDIIVLGNTKSSDFPTTDDAFQKDYLGDYDIFITKFSSNGSMIYSSYLGANGEDIIKDFDLDSSNFIIAGRTTSTSFPVTASSADQPVIGGGADGFLMRLSVNCSTVLYSTFVGGNNNEGINEIDIDTQDNIIVTGTTQSENFPITTDAYQSSISSTDDDIFIAKYNSSGQKIYATYFGGSHADYSFGLATDSVGNIIISGTTLSADFPIMNAWQVNYSNTMRDAFVTKLSVNGQQLIFSSYFGGSGWDIVHHVEVDSNDNIIVSGIADIDSNGFPILDAFQEDIRGRCDIIIMLLSPNGQPLFGTYLGGGEIDHPCRQYLTSDYLYIVGFTESEEFLTTSDSYQQTIRGNHDGFLFRFDIDGYLTALTSETTSESELFPTLELFILLVGLLSAIGIVLRIRGKK